MPITVAQCRMARAGLNLTLEQLAEAAGVGRRTIFRLENGGNIKPSTLTKIQAALAQGGATFHENGSVSVTGPLS